MLTLARARFLEEEFLCVPLFDGGLVAAEDPGYELLDVEYELDDDDLADADASALADADDLDLSFAASFDPR